MLGWKGIVQYIYIYIYTHCKVLFESTRYIVIHCKIREAQKFLLNEKNNKLYMLFVKNDAICSVLVLTLDVNEFDAF